jgi:hypothetical protein
LFRGLDKGHDDDEVDALVSACDGAFGSAVGGNVKLLGKSYPGSSGVTGTMKDF